MARLYPGIFPLPGTFSPTGQGPTDERSVVKKISDLTDPSIQHNGDYLYDGISVTVVEDNEGNKIGRTYVCIDKDNYTDEASWVATGSDSTGSIEKEKISALFKETV